ncbi:MAG: 50S ribosomal protein L1 [Candidatus Omnitrophica bacterium]|nr:50S ribosomal protein L1 [Candidatus Omnitrophota bacterium]
MVKISKRKKSNDSLLEKDKRYSLKEAVSLIKNASKTKFDESVDISMKLNVKPKEVTQPIRGTVALPHGTGKKTRVCCLCKGEDESKAKAAGAEYVGADELITKITGGWTDFDVVVTTPEMMKDIARLGKILGPKGLMPNPKSGTVTKDIDAAIKEIKRGKIEYKMDKQSGIHASIARLSFDETAIIENAREFLHAVITTSPALAKPQTVGSIAISKTMGPGVKLEISEFKR